MKFKILYTVEMNCGANNNERHTNFTLMKDRIHIPAFFFFGDGDYVIIPFFHSYGQTEVTKGEEKKGKGHGVPRRDMYVYIHGYLEDVPSNIKPLPEPGPT